MKQEMSLEVKFLMQQAAANAKKFTSDIKGINAELQKSSAGKELKQAFTGIEQEAKKADIAFRLFGVSSSDLKNRQSQLKAAAVDLVASGIAPERKEIQSLITEYQRLGSESDTLESSQQGLFGIFDKLKSEIGSVAAITAAVAFDKAIIGAGSFAMEAADSFQTARNEWGTLLQDMEAGAAVFDSIIKPFNDKTPFELDTVDQAAKVLRAAKVEISDLTNWLTRMGDLSQGNAQKMQSFTNAFSKASAKGKADMEVLNVYIDQGVPILDALAKQAGVSSAEIVKMASDGKISFADYASALEEMTSKGGQYYGGLELASKSYKAMQEGLNESVKSLAASFGQMLLPAGIKVVEFLTNTVNVINDSPFLKGTLAAALTAVTVAINLMAGKALVGLIAKLWSSFAAQMALNTAQSAFNPIMLAAVVAVAAGVAIYTTYAAKQQEIANANNEAALSQASFNEQVKLTDEALKSLTITQLDQQIGAVTTTLQNAQAELADINKKIDPIRNKPFYILKGKAYVQTDTGEYTDAYNDILDKAEEVQKRVNDIQKEINKLQGIKTEKQMAEAIAAGNDLLKERDKAYEKTIEYQEEQLKNNLKWAESLRTARVTNEDGSTSGLHIVKTEAIIKKAQEELDAFYEKNKVKIESLSTEWTDKNLKGIASIEREKQKSTEKLNADALAKLGKEYATQEAYLQEMAQLNEYYNIKIDEFKEDQAKKDEQEAQKRKDEIRSLLAERKRAYLEEAQYRQALAAQSMESAQNPQDYFSAAGDYAAQSFKTAIADTDFGSLLSGAGDPMTMFIDATIKAAMEVESLSKVLNFASTIVDKMFSSGLGDSLDRMFSDKARELESYGTSFGQILSFAVNALSGLLFVLKLMNPGFMILEGALKLAGNSFEWLNNRILVPVGNGFIRAANAFITELNKLPGIDIPKIKQFSVIGELAEEIAKELEKQQNSIKESFERQKQTIDDTLRSQIDSIQSQYELGLITRAQYEASANNYMDAASTARTQIEDQMNSALEALAEAAEGASAIDDIQPQKQKSLWEQVGDSIKNGFINSFTGIKDDFLNLFRNIGSIIPTPNTVTSGLVSTVNSAIDLINKIPGVNIPHFATGTTNIPRDMMAYVHQGEGVFPKTFMEGIRNNEIAIVGPEFTSPSQGRSGGNYFMVSIHVEGSVVTERKLIDVVYDGIVGAIGTGEKTPLPAGAF